MKTMFAKMPLIQLKIWKSYFYFALMLSLYPMVSSFPKETHSLDSQLESEFKEGTFDYKEIRRDLTENVDYCRCEKGKCETEGGKLICKCPPEYGLLTPTMCNACECGKGFNCTFDVGFWSYDKYCLCSYGQEKNEPCKNVDACTSKPCKNDGECSLDGSSFKCKCKFPWTGRTCEEDYNFPTSDTTAFFSTTSPVIEYTRNISFETTYEPSNPTESTMSSYDPSKDYNATAEPSEFTLDFNVTSEVFDNFTNSNNQTFEPWNTTVEYSTTEESSNHTLYFTTVELPFNETVDFNQTSETPLDFTVDYNKTTDFKDNLNITTALPTKTTSVDGLSTSVTASTSKPVIYIFRNVYAIQNLTELIIKT